MLCLLVTCEARGFGSRERGNIWRQKSGRGKKKGRVRDGSTSAKQSQIAARIQGSVLHRAAGSLPLLSIAPQLQQSRGESTLFNTPRGDDERSCSKALSPVSVSVVRGRRFESTSGRIRYRRALGGGPFPR